MFNNQKELGDSIELFALTNRERPKKLNVFLSESNQLVHFGILLKGESNEVAAVGHLRMINRILDGFGRVPRTGTLAEDTDSLDHLLRAAKKASTEVAKTPRLEVAPTLKDELQHLEQQMKTIIKFLEKRRRDIHDLNNFRIGGY